MPTNATDTDSFPANVQRPNNGELADAGSLSQGFNPLTQRTRYIHNRLPYGSYDPHRLGAVGSGTVDDYPAIAAAAAEAAADNGGVIWLRPGRSYRLDSELVLDGRVSIRTMKGSGSFNPTRLLRNHAGRLLKIDNLTGLGGQTPTVIEGVSFFDVALNTEAMVDVIDGSLTLLGCHMQGDAALTGNHLIRCSTNVRDSVRLRDCFLDPIPGLSAIRHGVGSLDVTGSTFVMPASYTGFLVDITSTSGANPALARFTGNEFFCSGTGTLFNLAGSYWAMTATGNHFWRSSATTTTGFAWQSGGERRLVVKGNTWDSIGTRYAPAGDALSFGSDLELTPHDSANYGAATTATIPNGVSSFTAQFSGAAPTITWPQILHQGQRFSLTISNQSGTPLGFSVAGAPPVVKETQSSIGVGLAATGHFEAMVLVSGLSWVQMGTWGYVS